MYKTTIENKIMLTATNDDKMDYGNGDCEVSLVACPVVFN